MKSLKAESFNLNAQLPWFARWLLVSLLALQYGVAHAIEDPPNCSLPNGGLGSVNQGSINFPLTQAHIGDRVPVVPSLGMVAGACRAIHATGVVYIAATPSPVPLPGVYHPLTNFLIDVSLDPGPLVTCPGDPSGKCQPGPYLVTITPGLVGAGVASPTHSINGLPRTVRVVENGFGDVQSGTPTEEIVDAHSASITIVTPCIRVVKSYAYPASNPTCFPPAANIDFAGYVTNCGDIGLKNITVADSRTTLVVLSNGAPALPFGGPYALSPGAVLTFSGSFAPTAAEVSAGNASSTTTVHGTDITTIGGPNAAVTNSATACCGICPALAPPVFTLSTNAYNVLETAGSVAVTVLKSPNSADGVVNFSTADGTGIAVYLGVGDYTNLTGSLSFSSGELSKTVSIGIRDNSGYYTGNRTFSFSLSNSPSGDCSPVGDPRQATVTIVDVDAPPASILVTPHLNTGCLPDHQGQFAVYLIPTNSGGQWRLAREIFWRDSGSTMSNLTTGNYEIEFRPVPGFLTPTNLMVVVPSGVPTPLQTNFPYARPVPALPVGSLTITLNPSQGQWRLLGDTAWLTNGATLPVLLAGNYVVEFNSVAGYATPPWQTAIVPAGPTNYTVTYQAPNNQGWLQPSPVPFNINNPCQPFGGDYVNNYLGELLTDSGFGSGCVVKRRVVLTAAHVVFNDLTLSYVVNVRWFFQRQAREYEPPQQTARGSYVLSGYAAARTNDVRLLGPGVSSPTSQFQDVAALFFFEDAGRGGQSGYLQASDGLGGQWLQQPGLSMTLIGYPVEGVSEAMRGQMYSTPLTNYTFNPVILGVFSTTSVAGLPGMSGGSLCVQYNGHYYPAGVYLGGSQQTLVRAIDYTVAELINRADVSGNTGLNNTGGGVVLISPIANGAASQAYVQLTLGPAAAVAAGAGWRLLGDTNTFENNPNFTYALSGTNAIGFEFKPITGWNLPPDQTIPLALGTVTNVAVNYSVANPIVTFSRTQGFGIMGASGLTYRIEYRTNLTSDGWRTLRTQTLGSGFNLLLPWPPTNGLPAAFYRVVWLP